MRRTRSTLTPQGDSQSTPAQRSLLAGFGPKMSKAPQKLTLKRTSVSISSSQVALHHTPKFLPTVWLDQFHPGDLFLCRCSWSVSL